MNVNVNVNVNGMLNALCCTLLCYSNFLVIVDVIVIVKEMNRHSLLWYPMRVSYSSPSRLLQLQEQLSQEPGIQQAYVPMEYRVSEGGMQPLPAIDNLLFLHTTYHDLSQVRRSCNLYEPLRYIMRPVIDDDGGEHSEVLYVPDAEMQQFIRVTSERSDQVVYLHNLAFACRPGARVQIIEGPFRGVEGIVKSIQKHLCVVIPIKDVAAVAITGIPKKHLIYLK